MSEMGQQRTSRPRNSTSALPPKADSSRTSDHVRKVPTTDIQADLGGLILHSQPRGRARNLSKLEVSGSSERQAASALTSVSREPASTPQCDCASRRDPH